jgi:hypothetical protein
MLVGRAIFLLYPLFLGREQHQDNKIQYAGYDGIFSEKWKQGLGNFAN